MKKGRKKNKLLLDTTLQGKRLVVSRDLYNWIVLFGSANSKNFMARAERWYFTDIEWMLRHLFKVYLKFNIRKIDYDDIIRAVKEAETRISKLGVEIDQKIGVEKGDKYG